MAHPGDNSTSTQHAPGAPHAPITQHAPGQYTLTVEAPTYRPGPTHVFVHVAHQLSQTRGPECVYTTAAGIPTSRFRQLGWYDAIRNVDDAAAIAASTTGTGKHQAGTTITICHNPEHPNPLDTNTWSMSWHYTHGHHDRRRDRRAARITTHSTTHVNGWALRPADLNPANHHRATALAQAIWRTLTNAGITTEWQQTLQRWAPGAMLDQHRTNINHYQTLLDSNTLNPDQHQYFTDKLATEHQQLEATLAALT